MDKLIDLEMEDSENAGLFSQADAEDMEKLQKVKLYTKFNLLCNKICFPDYKSAMSPSEADCH